MEAQRRRRPHSPLPDAVVRPDYFASDVDRVRSSLTEEQRASPQYAADNHEAWAAYFQRRQEQRLASTNGAPVVGAAGGTARGDACGGPSPAGRSARFSRT